MEWAASKAVPIAQLTPDKSSSRATVRGVVTVIWPYSSSQQELSLLLAEKDFRLRPHGQVRVIFYGHSAKEVADLNLISGDELVVTLDGVEWLSEPGHHRNPSKGIEWKLRYSRRLLLARYHESSEEGVLPEVVDIDRSSPTPRPASASAASLTDFDVEKQSLQRSEVLQKHGSPTTSTLPKYTLPYLPPFRLDAEEDLLEQDGRRSKRAKFGRRSTEWRFAERSPSPTNQLPIQHQPSEKSSQGPFRDVLDEPPRAEPPNVGQPQMAESSMILREHSQSIDDTVPEAESLAVGDLLGTPYDLEELPTSVDFDTAFMIPPTVELQGNIEQPDGGTNAILSSDMHQGIDMNRSDWSEGPIILPGPPPQIVEPPSFEEQDLGLLRGVSDAPGFWPATTLMQGSTRALSTPVESRNRSWPDMLEHGRAYSNEPAVLQHGTQYNPMGLIRESEAVVNDTTLGATPDQPIEIVDLDSEASEEESIQQEASLSHGDFDAAAVESPVARSETASEVSSRAEQGSQDEAPLSEDEGEDLLESDDSEDAMPDSVDMRHQNSLTRRSSVSSDATDGVTDDEASSEEYSEAHESREESPVHKVHSTAETKFTPTPPAIYENEKKPPTSPRKDQEEDHASNTSEEIRRDVVEKETPQHELIVSSDEAKDDHIVHRASISIPKEALDGASDGQYDGQARQATVEQKPGPAAQIAVFLQRRFDPESREPFQGFGTPLSYFVTLSSLAQHFNNLVDVLAIVVSSSRAKQAPKGARDHYLTLFIVDPWTPSMLSYTTAQVFRHSKKALPQANVGDAVLLRNFKVQTQNRKFHLLSCESSAWAVFPDNSGEYVAQGPPVELGPEEREFALSLRAWWIALEEQSRIQIEDEAAAEKRQGNVARPSTTSIPSMVRHELRDGTSYTDGIKKATHQLRDGTKYADS